MTIVSKRRDPQLAWPRWGFYSRFLTVAFGRFGSQHFHLHIGPFGINF